jgi:hypothetical protein
MENFSEILSNKCHRNSTIDRRIKAEGASESSKNEKI